MHEVHVDRFTLQSVDEWNGFVKRSKNGTFLFDRSYMDYHANRFSDHSLLIRIDGRLSALFVANEKGKSIHSHDGLTYGGLLLEPAVHLLEVIRMFREITHYYYDLGFETIAYKCVPAYLHSFPSNEDQFVMFALGAKLSRRDTSSVISREQLLPYTYTRTKSIDEGRSKNFRVSASADCTKFWNEVLIPNLQKRYDASPVHTADEMNLLMSRFDIKMFEVRQSNVIAGTVAYVFNNCVHTQYLSTTAQGRISGALDFLIDQLLREYPGKNYFSLGTSNNRENPDLNIGLLQWKEGFGARTYTHDIYEIATNSFTLLDRYE
jgi:hypothetical protein